jgi:hypothetical protein
MARLLRSRACLARSLVFAALHVAVPAAAQDGTRVTGVVLDEQGRGMAGVNVFLAGTVDGAITDSAGSFAFETLRPGAGELVALRDGFADHRQPIDIPPVAPVRIVLLRLVEVAAITARAGGYTAGDEPGAALTSLDVVTTPGAQASVPLAIKALPGVQGVDDGSGLFVRGGDDSETRFFLNGAGVIDAVRPEEPTGSDAPQIDPFLLDRIFFSSGAFGARYGDALSAVVDLETRGRPARLQKSVGAHMAGVEGSIEGPLSERLGGALTLSRLHVGPIYAVNGSTREYAIAPQGWEASGSLVWDYRPDARLKAFGIGETFRTAFEVEDPSLGGEYAIERETWAAIASWEDALGPARAAASVSRSAVRTEEGGGAYRLVDDRASTQASASVHVAVGTALVLAAGADVEDLEVRWLGRFPPRASDAGDPLDDSFDDARDALRAGAFVEAEWALGARAALAAGIRSDRSTLSHRRTWDPRLSLTASLPAGLSLLLGGGVYHQVADPLLYARADERLAPQRALQLVAGVQMGDPAHRLLRVEAYAKEYEDLAQLDRDDRAAGGGEGSSRGIDLFLKGRGPAGTNGWVAYSLVDAERTDPATGALARAPFDVTHSLVVVAGRQLRPGWNARAAWRYATGRPFTDVIGAEPAADGPGLAPVYGAPFAERQPAFHRLDLSFSRLVFFGDDGLLVLFASLNNAYDRENVLEYRWTDDFTTRIPVRDRTKRSVFVGMSLDF